MPQRARIRASVYITLIFLCGFVAGTLANTAWKQWVGSATAASSRRSSTQHTVERLTRELSLSGDQTRQLNDILDETHRQYREHEDKIETVRQQGRDRIRKILTDDQRGKYEQILAKLESSRKRPGQ
jgi:septal ring factor EnvC (AmiA/AmiB activator)